jgi:hypothetical protein
LKFSGQHQFLLSSCYTVFTLSPLLANRQFSTVIAEMRDDLPLGSERFLDENGLVGQLVS